MQANANLPPTKLMLDVPTSTLAECCDYGVQALSQSGAIDQEVVDGCRELLEKAVEAGPTHRANHVAVFSVQHEGLKDDFTLMLRLRQPIDIVGEEKGDGLWFVWLLFSPSRNHPRMQTVAEFINLAADDTVRKIFMDVPDADSLRASYNEAVRRDTHFEAHIPDELRPTGRLFGGFIADIKRRLPHYISDYTDGLNGKSVASIFFLYFACLAPAIAFGGLLAAKTNNEVGAIEMLLATAICGITYALFSGQPLTILGSTGPVVIFMYKLYELCGSMSVPFLPTLCWVGLWTMVFLLILAFTDASCWIRYFTRFTDDTFAALIALIFIYEAALNIGKGFGDADVQDSSALLSLVLALGTFYIASTLRRFRQSAYMAARTREFFADFGPAIAIVTMAWAASLMVDVPLETLSVPDSLSPSIDRPWLVNPLEAPKWVWGAAALPAVLVSILLYLDQNITVRLVNNPEYGLKKGAGYHLDLALVGVLVGVCSMLGLPWMVAATVRSLNHVRALATTRNDGVKERVVSVVESRVSGLGVHVLVAVSLFALGVLKMVPMSVLFGLFLFMGISAMGGNQFFERFRLWAMDPDRYPPTYYLRAVPTKVVHTFTAIQAVCLSVLWIVKTSSLGILFPLFIGLLVPVRVAMGKFFDYEHLALLDAEEEPDEEQDREGA